MHAVQRDRPNLHAVCGGLIHKPLGAGSEWSGHTSHGPHGVEQLTPTLHTHAWAVWVVTCVGELCRVCG
eukprot:2168787-Prymnesium_polylepis.1